MQGNRTPEESLFDDLAAEEERLAEEEQAELDAAAAEEVDEPQPDPNDPATVLAVLDKLKAENEELKDKTLRTVAEMDNLRKRTAREMADTRAYSVAGFARDLLGVGDNLQRAILAVPEEKRQSGSDEFKALIEGVEMTERELLKSLENAGVKKFNPQGEKFDPNLHQAMFEIPDTEVPNNSVHQVVQEGFMIGERVLRPAMVGVAKGGPKFEEEAPSEAAGAESDPQAATDEQDDT